MTNVKHGKRGDPTTAVPIRITERQIEMLKVIAFSESVGVSTVIRTAIDQYLASNPLTEGQQTLLRIRRSRNSA